jgi:ribosomal protein L11
MLKEKKKKKKENQKLFELNIKFLSFYLKANTATVSPPLSSVLGNFGLNTMNFCKEFNSITEQLVSYFLLKVFVKIDLSLKT